MNGLQQKKKFNIRLIPLYVIYAAACTFFFVKLVNLQITGTDRYVKTMSLTHEREVVVQSLRGEIYDRNGAPLVTNEYTESLQLDYASVPRDTTEKNEALTSVISVLAKNGVEIETVMPVKGTYPHIEYDNEALKSTSVQNGMYRFLLYHNIKTGVSCLDLYEELLKEFKLLDEDGEHIYDTATEDALIRLLYSLDATNFAPGNPYPLVADADLKLTTAVLESGCKGVFIKKNYTRVYGYPGVGSNIIGRVGKIPEDKMQDYLAKGYSYDAVVGLDGAEAAFEDILRGEDGITVYVEDDYGNVIETYVKKEAVPGKNVYLTIDINLQAAAEKELEAQIKPDPERADELEREFKKGFDQTIMKRIWPDLSAICAIWAGNFSSYVNKLREYSGRTVPYYTMSYASSEGVFGFARHPFDTSYCMVPQSCFYEFIPVDGKDAEDVQDTLLMEELQEGKEYELVITNQSGLYRYRMGDVVRVTGFYNETPMIEFRYRKKNIVSVAGEKFTEAHLLSAVREFERRSGVSIIDFCMYPDTSTAPGRYVVLLEPDEVIAESKKEEYTKIIAEELVRASSSYAHYVEIGNMGKPVLKFLQPQTFRLHRELKMYKAGISENQLKPVRVLDTPELVRFFTALEEK